MVEPDAIIVDLDGTLWDPTATCITAWKRAFTELQLTANISDNDLRGIFGMQHDLVGASLFPDCAPDERDAIMERCYAAELDVILERGGKLYPDVRETIEHIAKRYPLHIVSNCQSGYIEAFFAFHGLSDYFTDFECSGNTGLPKADNIRLVMKRNGLDTAVYIGDTQGDYDAAMANHVPFIFAAYGFGSLSNGHNAISVDTFAEIRGILPGLAIAP